MSFMDVGILFFKRVCYVETRFKNLIRIANEAKQRIHAMNMHYSDYVMTWTTAITSISNTLKKLLLHSYLHLSYIQIIYNGKEEIINNIFSAYVEPLLNHVNRPALVQEWKLNIDAAAYEKVDAKVNRPSDKNKLIVVIARRTGPQASRKQFSSFVFSPLWSILKISLKQIYH